MASARGDGERAEGGASLAGVQAREHCRHDGGGWARRHGRHGKLLDSRRTPTQGGKAKLVILGSNFSGRRAAY